MLSAVSLKTENAADVVASVITMGLANMASIQTGVACAAVPAMSGTSC